MSLFRRLGPRVWLPAAVVVIAALSIAPTGGTVLKLRAGGATVEPGGSVATIPADSAARFIVGTSVLNTADLADPAVARQVVADRAWLSAGDVPGPAEFAGMAARALLDLRALTLPNGALIAAPVTSWKNVWPRDASFAAVAYALTGHHDDAAQVLRFLAEVAPEDGLWEARYRPDGSGPPDDRPKQLDGAGWVPWAVWVLVSTAPDAESAAAVVDTMRGPVIASADAIVASLSEDGLPRPSSDYWEKSESKVTLGIAAPLSLGLRSSIALGDVLDVDVRNWRVAAERLDRAIEEEFGAHGYPRTLSEGGADAAVTFVAPPFAHADPSVREAVVRAESALRVANGGHRPGEVWDKDVGVAWTPETALFALALAGLGRHEEAEELLRFLELHRTSQGSLPEKVDARSAPASVAPLAWTSSLVLLTLAEMDGRLPLAPSI